MGDPKTSTKMYSRPLKRWDKVKIESDRELMTKYGLRRKTEIWKSESIVRKLKHEAQLLTRSSDEETMKNLISKVNRLGLVESGNATLDDVLELGSESVLVRRLQTQVHKAGLANTMRQARQFIVHGHISVDGVRVTSPKYHVNQGDEKKLTFYGSSSLGKIFKLGHQKAAKPKEVVGETSAEAKPEEVKVEAPVEEKSAEEVEAKETPSEAPVETKPEESPAEEKKEEETVEEKPTEAPKEEAAEEKPEEKKEEDKNE